MFKTIHLMVLVLTCGNLIADDAAENETAKVIEGEARIYGLNLGWPNGYKDIPSGGNFELIRKLDEVVLDIDNKKNQIKIVDVVLIDVATVINAQLPNASGWKISVAEDVKNKRVSGVVSQDLLRSLVNLLQNGDVYCLIADGVVEFRDAKKLLMPKPNKINNKSIPILPSPVWIKPVDKLK